MHISRIRIQNFRNFSDIDVAIGQNAVFLGENKVGKSNLLYALRLLLDPALAESARYLREEDFWDGLKRPLKKTDQILISVDIADFETNKHQLALLAEHLIAPKPMVAQLTYVWRPLATLKNDPTKDSDYEFVVYGGGRPENRLSYELRRRLPMELIPALRDCEGDLARWTRSPLRPLLDKAASTIERESLEKVANGVDKATDNLTKLKDVKAVSEAISRKLLQMVGSAQYLETILRFSPTDADKLIRSLRIFIDGGKRSISDASLGSANLLYFALTSLEHDHLIEDGARDFTFVAIEEPEAHLHPILQRLIFRNYLRQRNDKDEGKKRPSEETVLMTTHSPHISSVTPINDFVVLTKAKKTGSTIAKSTADIRLEDNEIADLERYIDATKGEFFFARGVLLVEGDAERLVVPVLAQNQGIDLDELGIVVSSALGTNFVPYLKLLGPNGLNIPLAVLTDFDPIDGGDALGPRRVVRMMKPVLGDKASGALGEKQLLAMAPKHGLFLNEHTFEVDLFKCGLSAEFGEAMNTLSLNLKAKARMKAWVDDPTSVDAKVFLQDIDAVGKGRFAQRLASVIAASASEACPKYVFDAIKYVSERTQP